MRVVAMKRFISSLLVSALLFGCALAEPLEPVVTDYSETVGSPSIYRLYDREFYESKSEQPGQVVRLDYTTSVYGEEDQKRWANVYVPACYDPNGDARINVIYFFHGNNCDQKVLLGNEATCNAFDHMIETGIAEPFIVVAPTYYNNVRKKTADLELFAQEIRGDLMPAVESAYRTYAVTPDDAGFKASRDHRAFCGFSRGGMTTWALFDDLLDYSRYFLPFSGPMAVDELENVFAAIDADAEGADDFFLYMASGGPEDLAYESNLPLSQALAADTTRFHYGTGEGDNFYFLLSDNIHQDLTTRYYLYNAFIDVLFR